MMMMISLLLHVSNGKASEKWRAGKIKTSVFKGQVQEFIETSDSIPMVRPELSCYALPLDGSKDRNVEQREMIIYVKCPTLYILVAR